MDIFESTLTTTGNMQNGVSSIFTLQAKDSLAANISSTDDLVYLIAEDVCTWDGNDCISDPEENDNLEGLPQEFLMTNNGDGTYTASLTVSDLGTLSVSAKVYRQGLKSEYEKNSDTQDIKYGEGVVHDWGTGDINGMSLDVVGDIIRVKFKGYILPP